MNVPRLLLIASYTVLCVMLGVGIWAALPARWLPVDAIGTALCLGCGAAAASLALGLPLADRLSRAVSWALLGCGAAATSALAWTAAHLAGLYGPVGAGGALLMAAVGALVAPYLLGLPALQLSALRRT